MWQYSLIAFCILSCQVGINLSETKANDEMMTSVYDEHESQIKSIDTFESQDHHQLQGILFYPSDSAHRGLTISDLQEMENQMKNLFRSKRTAHLLILKPLPLNGKKYSGDIIDAINKCRYTFAQKLLFEVAEGELQEVIRNICDKCPFDLVIEFVEALIRIDPSYQILECLYDTLSNEIDTDKEIRPQKMLAMGRCLQLEVINHSRVSSDTEEKAEALLDEVVRDLTESASDFFADCLIKNKYEKTKNLAFKLKIFTPDINNDVVYLVVEKTFNTTSAKHILHAVNSHDYIQQRLAGILALFEKVHPSDDNTNDEVIIRIAKHLSEIVKEPHYKLVDKSLVDQVIVVRASMPDCVEKLFFSNYVCLENQANFEDLIAANATYNYDVERRHIFTTSGSKYLRGSHWEVATINGGFFFKNRDRHFEYLYSSDSVYNDEFRNVFTWVPGGGPGFKAAWKAEIRGDNCAFKNVRFQEYLVSSMIIEFSDYKYVFTSKSGYGNEAEWRVRNCDV